MIANINYGINLKDGEFAETVQRLLSENNIEQIIETGTYNGLGSTTVFAKTGIPVTTVESCLTNYKQAVDNLKQYSNVSLIYATSLNVDDMTNFIEEDDIYESKLVKDGIIFADGSNNSTHQVKQFYKNEISGWGDETPTRQNVLKELINNDRRQLVFLDSAGGVGYLEFREFMTLSNERRAKKVLLLDDVSHVKHYRSVAKLKREGYNVNVSSDVRFAYCAFV